MDKSFDFFSEVCWTIALIWAYAQGTKILLMLHFTLYEVNRSLW